MTDSDHKLLTLAAKAAGFEVQLALGLTENDSTLFIGDKAWQPLTDDGDALRLAVKLEMEIDVCINGVAVRTPSGVKVLEGKCADIAATRRAIVRAAAAIGEAMQ